MKLRHGLFVAGLGLMTLPALFRVAAPLKVEARTPVGAFIMASAWGSTTHGITVVTIRRM